MPSHLIVRVILQKCVKSVFCFKKKLFLNNKWCNSNKTSIFFDIWAQWHVHVYSWLLQMDNIYTDFLCQFKFPSMCPQISRCVPNTSLCLPLPTNFKVWLLHVPAYCIKREYICGFTVLHHVTIKCKFLKIYMLNIQFGQRFFVDYHTCEYEYH